MIVRNLCSVNFYSNQSKKTNKNSWNNKKEALDNITALSFLSTLFLMPNKNKSFPKITAGIGISSSIANIVLNSSRINNQKNLLSSEEKQYLTSNILGNIATGTALATSTLMISKDLSNNKIINYGLASLMGISFVSSLIFKHRSQKSKTNNLDTNG